MYFSCDIGATKTRVAFSKDCKKIEKIVIYKTPKSFSEGIEKLYATILGFSKNRKIKGIVLGVPGPLDKNKTKIEKAPNLPLWRGKPLKKTLLSMFKTNIFLENDTALVGLGEAVEGAGKNCKISAYITLSTGVNGVKIENKKIDENFFGFEIGHQVLELKDGNPIYIERLIGGRWIKEKYKKEPYEIKSKKVWQEIENYVAILVNNAIVHWSPECVIVGGSLSKSINLDRIKKLVEKICIFPKIPLIKKAKFGDIGGIKGGFVLLKSNGRCAL